MAEEVDAKLVKQVKLTQELLGEFVKRPSLTEKHLMRPPFRYLHDIFMAVMDTTGFFRGLFTPEEQNSANITKEGKTAVIDKVVAVIEMVSGQKLEIKPSKILAGQDADKTNVLLQLLAKCLKQKKSSNEAVKSITGVDPVEKKTVKASEPAKQASKPVDGGRGKQASPSREVAKPEAKTRPGETKDRKPPAAAAKVVGGPYASKQPPTKTVNKAKAPTQNRTPSKEREVAPTPPKPPQAEEQVTRSRRGSQGSPSRNTKSKEDIPEKIPSRDRISNDGPSSRKSSLQDITTGIARRDSKSSLKEQKQGFGSDEDVGNESDNGNDGSIGNLRENNILLPETIQPEAPVSKSDRGESSKPKVERPPSRSNIRQRTAEQMNRDEQEVEDTILAPTPARQPVVPSEPDENESPDKKPIVSARPPTSSVKSRPPPSARPSSARPGAPRPFSARPLVIQVDENAFRPTTGKVMNVLKDNEEADDDADNYVVQELPPPSKGLDEMDETGGIALGEMGLGDIDSAVPEGQRGLLLSQILETHRELEGGKSKDDGQEDSERFTFARESSKAEIERLRSLIQTAAKSSHPLGKLMDFIQEDVDAIYQELTKWQEESFKLDAQLEGEIGKSEESLKPLHLELAQLEEEIQMQEDAIDATRMNILQQEERIQKVINGFETVPQSLGFNQTIELPPVIKVFGFDLRLDPEERKLVLGEGSPMPRAKSHYVRQAPPPVQAAENEEFKKQRKSQEFDFGAKLQEMMREPEVDESGDRVQDVDMPPGSIYRRGSKGSSHSRSSQSPSPSPAHSGMY